MTARFWWTARGLKLRAWALLALGVVTAAVLPDAPGGLMALHARVATVLEPEGPET